MLCPRDQSKLQCLETRTFDDGTVRRRYKCHTCGNKFATVEELVTSLDGLSNYFETRVQYEERTKEELTEQLAVKFSKILVDEVARDEAIETLRKGVDALQFFGNDTAQVKNLAALADMLEEL